MMEYEQLKTSCRGNGIDNCVLCGYDHTSSEKKLQLVTCDKCSKVSQVCNMASLVITF